MSQSVLKPYNITPGHMLTPVFSQYASLMTSPDLHNATMAIPATVHDPCSQFCLPLGSRNINQRRTIYSNGPQSSPANRPIIPPLSHQVSQEQIINILHRGKNPWPQLSLLNKHYQVFCLSCYKQKDLWRYILFLNFNCNKCLK